ncbi:acyl-CoA dehydrogenase family protein [Companilactobacillus mishanensis]|uniref:acyl-CoA dehydrogenase family protein n=1 Tax=Companilactobacillus mishanensis TaxID=2486008 RepID=UPI001295913E|nr:acyl-CoA dehydrogenase family protein [Companilactobacillus mishanensis]MQS88199.1 acyl-CoA dehydrogenase [Companilactobacillus mishanensis]
MHKYYEEAKEFGKKYLADEANEVDVEGRFPKASVDALRKAGYFGLVIPKEYGGQGKGIEEHAEVCTGLAESGASASLCYMMSNVGAYCLSLYASEEMKKDILPRVASGEIILGLAYSETGSGTHFYRPDMTEEPHDGYSILNGRKSFVTTAREADYYLTITHSTKDGSNNLWLVPRDAEGLSFESTFNGLGLRGNVSDPMVLDHVKLDESCKIPGNGDGDRLIFIVGLASSSAGISMAIADAAAKYVKERSYTSGKSLADIETVEVNVAELKARAYAARETLFAGAASVAAEEEEGFPNVIAARITTTEAAVKNGTEGMRLFGGIGYVRNVQPMERLMRDSLGAQVMAPGLDVLKVWLGRLSVDLPYLND